MTTSAQNIALKPMRHPTYLHKPALVLSCCQRIRQEQKILVVLFGGGGACSSFSVLHTLNGSALGMARTVAAIIETYQRPDGNIDVPEVLQAYLRTPVIEARAH